MQNFSIPKFKKSSIRRFNNKPPPLKLEVTDEARRIINEQWYWTQRDELMKKYQGKGILVDNGEVIGEYSCSITANNAYGKKPYAYMALVGDEYYWKIVYSPYNQFTPLVTPERIPPKIYEDKCLIESFVPGFTYYGFTQTPWVKLPITTTEKSTHCIPVWFLLDTKSSITCITEETSHIIFGKIKTEPKFIIYVNGKRIVASLSTNEYFNVNLLGTDYLWENKVLFDKKENIISLTE